MYVMELYMPWSLKSTQISHVLSRNSADNDKYELSMTFLIAHRYPQSVIHKINYYNIFSRPFWNSGCFTSLISMYGMRITNHYSKHSWLSNDKTSELLTKQQTCISYAFSWRLFIVQITYYVVCNFCVEVFRAKRIIN